MKPIIEVKNLSKRYKLGVFNAKTLREEAEAFLSRFSRKNAHTANGTRQTASGLVTSNSSLVTSHTSHAEPSSDFWALRDVSFDVQPGEVIGVIGRNGAGKSTLLKILSRITEPTSGEARIRGRVASLLEVGTGFHPELTGRENIFLNGAILGMTKQEIRSKFDEIVAFAEIEKFIDTPVKRYSSGMYVRLAFAVAAHLEPEILIVDEVLAVGDAEFQNKCLGKMRDVATGGRTVLFVSHNLGAVQSLCDRAILLESGQLALDGEVSSVLSNYSSRLLRSSALPFKGPLLDVASVTDISLTAPNAPRNGPFLREADITLTATLHAHHELANVQALAGLTSNGTRICTMPAFPSRRTMPAGDTVLTWLIPAWFLRPGTYQVGLGVIRRDAHDWLWTEQAVTLEILQQWRSSDDKHLDGLVDFPNP